MPEFEWDENKSQSNRQKHGISFERAKETFDDPNSVTFKNDSGAEIRFIRVGKTAGRILLSVVYTFRITIIRIISARSPRKDEIKDYLANSLIKKAKDYED